MRNTTYILAPSPDGAVCIGRTDDLVGRLAQHRAGATAHRARYGIDHLVRYEHHERFEDSLRRERSHKRWRRAWKNALITERNPHWRDLSPTLGA